jgi:hypothetical protein
MLENILFLSSSLFAISLFLLVGYVYLIVIKRTNLFFRKEQIKCRTCKHYCHKFHDCDDKSKTNICIQCKHYHLPTTKDGVFSHGSCDEVTLIRLRTGKLEEISCECTICHCSVCNNHEILCECKDCTCVKCSITDKKYILLIGGIIVILFICCMITTSLSFALMHKIEYDDHFIRSVTICGSIVVVSIMSVLSFLMVLIIYYYERINYIEKEDNKRLS